MLTEIARPSLLEARRVVIKLGTRVLSDPHGGLALERLRKILRLAAELRSQQREVLLVTSGSVGLGAHALDIGLPIRGIGDRQACAAVGQSRLMSIYERELATHGLTVGQVLLTHGDFEDRDRYLNIRNTLLSLLRHGVLPIINENDAVSIAELQDRGSTEPVFGDNDRLSAVVASKLGADLLLLLTDVSGLYEQDPTRHPHARLLSRVEISSDSEFEATAPTSAFGRGGMQSKVEAARLASRAGCHAVIASGLDPEAVSRVLRGAEEGTWFLARSGLNARRRWIAWGSPAKGTLYLDAGAISAIRERGASLLAAGVTRLEGRFVRGDVVELRSLSHAPVGRGMVSCDTDAAASWIAGEPPAAAQNHHALVHRDHLVLEPSP
jgi:glutamate 5-kinase